MKDMDVFIIVVILSIGAAMVLPEFLKPRPQGGCLTSCPSNLKNVATALEMYASDNGGAYPLRLNGLTAGNYLKLVPTCPAAGTDTYSPTYRTRRGEFYFGCQGNNHNGKGGSPANYPRYDSQEGLLLR